MRDSDQLLERIEEYRRKLQNLIELREGNCTDPEIIRVSKQLDELLNIYGFPTKGKDA